MRKPRFTWNSEKRAIVRSMSKTHTVKDASEVVGCSSRAVTLECHRLDISFMKYGDAHHATRHSNEDVELMRQCHDAGMTHTEIVEKFEMSSGGVSQILNHSYRNNDACAKQSVTPS